MTIWEYLSQGGFWRYLGVWFLLVSIAACLSSLVRITVKNFTSREDSKK